MYNKDAIKIDGGPEIVRNVMLDHSGNARYRLLYATDNPQVNDQQKQITVPWTQIGTNYSWDILEIKRNATGKRFVELMKSRRTDGLWSLAELIEDRAWKTPDNATDRLHPFGVPYYLNKLTAAQIAASVVAGFSGQTIAYQDASTTTVCAGIDAATEPKWRNYAAQYAGINGDFLKIARLAFIKTAFKAPYNIDDPSKARTARKAGYVNLDTMVELQNLLDARDDNTTPKDLMGGVMARIGMSPMLNNVSILGIPQLDADTSNPLYIIDFSRFQPVVQDGYWMEESGSMSDRTSHTTFTVFLDGSHNNLCLSRRKAGFVLHQ